MRRQCRTVISVVLRWPIDSGYKTIKFKKFKMYTATGAHLLSNQRPASRQACRQRVARAWSLVGVRPKLQMTVCARHDLEHGGGLVFEIVFIQLRVSITLGRRFLLRTCAGFTGC